MQYIMLILLLPAVFYALSYARYNWSNKNRKAASGVILMVIVSIILTVTIVLMQMIF